MKKKGKRRQYLLMVDLRRYKWYQSQIPGDVLAFPVGFPFKVFKTRLQSRA